MKNMVRNSMVVLFFVLSFVSIALATAAPEDQGGSMLLTLFIGFFALIVVFQLVPACLLFVGMLKGLFSRDQTAKKKLPTYK